MCNGGKRIGSQRIGGFSILQVGVTENPALARRPRKASPWRGRDQASHETRVAPHDPRSQWFASWSIR
jgi:hypothetical protein